MITMMNENEEVVREPRKTLGTYGQWAVHSDLGRKLRGSENLFVISHIPTGLKAYESYSLERARKLAKMFHERVTSDWDDLSGGVEVGPFVTVNKYFIEELKKLIDEWLYST